MTNEQLIKKMKEDMKMRGFSHWTETSYIGKTKEMMKYFRKPMEEVTIEELRNFLLKYLREERKLSERSVNYYNSVIRFIYEVTLDKLINKKQLPMYRRRKMKDVLTKEELSTFFNACENYMYKTIFMMIYGSGLRVSEAVNLKIEDIDNRKMMIFVRAGKGGKDRYTVLPQTSLEMLRKYYKMYKPKHPEGYLFLNREGNPLTIERTREFFRRYRKKAKIDDKFVIHSLRHRICNWFNRKRSKYIRSKNTEVWSGTVGNSYAGGTGSKEDPYLIENGEQLAYLAEQVNNGEKYTGKYFKIIKSINLGGANWIPIGGIIENIIDLEDIENYFDGELDGQDNIIANLSITQNEQRPIWLIGMLGENGTVKNIKITSGNVTGEVYIGAIVGLSKGTIENCINNAEIESKGLSIGGIAGYAISGNISNCVNEGNIIEKGEEGKAVGGIVGQKTVEGIIENSYYYTESTIKGIGSESDEIGTKNPVEDIVGVTEKSRRKYRNIWRIFNMDWNKKIKEYYKTVGKISEVFLINFSLKNIYHFILW